MWYQQQLLGFVKSMCGELETALKPDKTTIFDTAVNDKGVTAFNIDRFFSTLKRYQGMDIEAFANRTAREFTARGNEQNAREVAENIKRQTSVDLQGFLQGNAKVAERVEQLTTANVALIKSIHSQYLDKVQNAVLQAQIKGELNADLANKIKQIGGVTESRAKLIARDQSAKVNAALTRARHEELGITHYRWSTSGDERVRDSHAELDGKIFAYDSPPEVGNPGDDFNCRCVAVPVFDKAEIEQAEKSEAEQGSAVEIEKELPKDLPINETTMKLIDGLKINNVEYREVQFLKEKLSVESIIAKLAGGDETKGSCVSLALSYIGNKIGLDVTDYRGGNSQSFFSLSLNLRKIVTLEGVNSKVFEVGIETKEIPNILEKHLVIGKEYILGAGRHAAIVRKTTNGLEYLELQAVENNGWKSFNGEYKTVAKTLQKRFGCRISKHKYKIPYKVDLAEVDSFKAVKGDLKEILGYLNTSEREQKKGSLGGTK